MDTSDGFATPGPQANNDVDAAAASAHAVKTRTGGNMTTFLTAVQILGGLLTPVIAILAVYIAWQQHKTGRAKLKLDLFDRRYQVYRGLMDLFSAVVREGTVSNEVLGNFYRETDQKRFLFGDDICEYLKEVREKAVKLRQAHRVLAPISQDRGQTITQGRLTEASHTEIELLAWFDKQVEQAGQLFQNDLGFKKNL
jgi:hypothetical protein